MQLHFQVNIFFKLITLFACSHCNYLFVGLRAMFAARCEEQVTHMDDLQRQLAAAEEEKKTLNQLLRLSVQQKLMVTQRLEEIEMDREMKNVRRSMGTPNTSSTPSKTSKRYNQPQRRDW